ncbi:MAG: ABC transporter substrate-binding protein, partial [Pseudomonadota bacterium]
MRATILIAAALAWLTVPTTAAETAADEPTWRHASSLSEAPGYPDGFAHFDYVNVEAPKGGRVRLADPTGFDSFNPVLTRGNPAPGIGLMYDQLMTTAMD